MVKEFEITGGNVVFNVDFFKSWFPGMKNNDGESTTNQSTGHSEVEFTGVKSAPALPASSPDKKGPEKKDVGKVEEDGDDGDGIEFDEVKTLEQKLLKLKAEAKQKQEEAKKTLMQLHTCKLMRGIEPEEGEEEEDEEEEEVEAPQ